jgi:phage tail-like protein
VGQQGLELWRRRGVEVALKDFRKDLILEVYNEAGQLAIAYKIYRCWVSEFQSTPDLDANANAVAIQHIKLENEGWERDLQTKEPSEPTFANPSA